MGVMCLSSVNQDVTFLIQCSVDYNSRQSAIYQLRTLNSRSVLAHTDIMTDQETIVKVQLNIHMRTRMIEA